MDSQVSNNFSCANAASINNLYLSGSLDPQWLSPELVASINTTLAVWVITTAASNLYQTYFESFVSFPAISDLYTDTVSSGLFDWYDKKLAKNATTFADLERLRWQPSTPEWYNDVVFTGNTDYPVVNVNQFNIIDYCGNFEIYEKLIKLNSDAVIHITPETAAMAGPELLGEALFRPSIVKGIQLWSGGCVTEETHSNLFDLIKEWYFAILHSDNELYRLFARFMVPLSEDLNNPNDFLNLRFHYIFSDIGEVYDYRFAEGLQFLEDITAYWPMRPEEHAIFRLILEFAGYTEMPTAPDDVAKVKNVMETLLNLYHKGIAVSDPTDEMFTPVHVVRFEYVLIPEGWEPQPKNFFSFKEFHERLGGLKISPRNEFYSVPFNYGLFEG